MFPYIRGFLRNMNEASQKNDIVKKSIPMTNQLNIDPRTALIFCYIYYLHFFLAIFAAIRIGSQTGENGGA